MAGLAQRALGTRGLRVSALGLGCVGISELYGPRELDESQAMLRRALELGVDFFDTPDVYGAGHNEQFLGEVLGSERRSIVLATKFGADEVAGIPAEIPRDAVAGPRYDREELARLGL